MRGVRQPTDSKLCMAACCATLTGCTLEEVLAEATLMPNGSMSLQQAVIFLARRNMGLGAWVSFAPHEATMEPGFQIDVPIKIDESPALGGVKSKRYAGFFHAVVWDNEIKRIWDPHYDDPQHIESYPMVDWAVVTMFEDDQCCASRG